MAIESVNPASGECLARHEPLSAEQLESKLERAWQAFQWYRRTELADRGEMLLRAAELLEGEREALAEMMTREMGKPVAAAEAEVEKCAWACRYYAEHGPALLADEEVATGARRSLVRYRPSGPLLAIMPWNFPFWQVFRFVAPALMGGNVCLLKHAANVPACALAIEDILRRAGFAEDVFQTLLIEVPMVASVIGDPRVRGVTLTGSTRAGAAVAEQAGRGIKKTVLELGGSDPFIVMPTADLDWTVEMAVAARTVNNGQSCIAAKRFIVHEAIYERFLERFVTRLAALRVGDPLLRETQIGPLATLAILEEVEAQVRDTVAAGARLLTGGERLPGPGYFYPPTALDRIPAGSPAADEEIFGPVAAIFTVSSREEAISRANDTRFGLAGSVWTTSEEDVDAFLDGLDTGQIFVNAMVASDPRLPFGGVKESGYGRELGVWGLREFLNVQTVWVGGSPPSGAE